MGMMVKLFARLSAVATCCLVLAAGASAQTTPGAEPSKLPGGSSSLHETFENWTLQCAASAKGRLCTVQQQQRHRETKQLVLAVDLAAGANGAVSGSFLLPFGLRLSSGAVLQVDTGRDFKPMAFSTCLPMGCVVPLNFDKAVMAQMRAGTMLKIKVIANDDGKPLALSVPLKGLAAALDRLAVLVQSGSASGGAEK